MISLEIDIERVQHGKLKPRKEGIPYDPKAIAYWCVCPFCKVKHIGKDHNEAILGTHWHKKDCIFVNPGGVFGTFNAYPIYTWRHKLIRKLPEGIKNLLRQAKQ